MTKRIPDRPLTEAEAGAKLDQEVRRVTRVLAQVRQTPGLYERLRVGNYRMALGAMETLLLELAEFWTDASMVEYLREERRKAGIVEPPHGGACRTPVEGGSRCSHPQEVHDEYTGRCLGRDYCTCEEYLAPQPEDAPEPVDPVREAIGPLTGVIDLA